jgi:L-rhamnose isomerase
MALPLLSLFWKSAFLAMEAQQVMALRMIRLAQGGAPAEREMRLMMSEKIKAATQTAVKSTLAMARGNGGLSIASDTVRSYRTRVRKNRRRLSAS